MKEFPRAAKPDITLQLLKEPYHTVGRLCRQLNSDFFATRVFGRRTICMKGPEAAELFYNPEYTMRDGAAPEPLKATLFGKGAIQSLDGEEHLRRKKIFMSFMTREKADLLSKIFMQELLRSAKIWRMEKEVSVYDEMQLVLTKSVCQWAGVPISAEEVEVRAKDLAAMFDSAGSGIINHFQSRRARHRTESWIAGLVKSQRHGKKLFASGSVAEAFSQLTNKNDEYVSPHDSAVEIINVLRPVVAVSLFIVFCIHALHFHPSYRVKIRNDSYFRYFFVQEVRRYYPFFPSVMSKAKHDFEWNGYTFKKGTRLILDLYGTNHDPHLWEQPNRFYPERFATKWINPFNFIPQGGGDYFANHRCPGENPTIILMTTALEFFSEKISYEVPEQNLDLNYNRLPAIPHSRFKISGIDFDRQSKTEREFQPKA